MCPFPAGSLPRACFQVSAGEMVVSDSGHTLRVMKGRDGSLATSRHLQVGVWGVQALTLNCVRAKSPNPGAVKSLP